MLCKKILAVIAIITSLAACEGGSVNKQSAGTILGGIGGAVVGAQFGGGTGQLVGVAAGTLIGAAIGNSIGASLDRADRTYYSSSVQSTMESNMSGQTSTWRNPDSGNYGTITPTKTIKKDDRYCREYTQTIHVGGKKQNAYGTACRQPDGTWQLSE
jgi:surface antigen